VSISRLLPPVQTMATELLEICKVHPHEFGGVQSAVLSEEELRLRMCAVRGCARAGWAQIHVPGTAPAEFRILCPPHYVIRAYLEMGMLGDTNYRGEAIRLARLAGVRPAELLDIDRSLPCMPCDWTCAVCGGNMVRLEEGWVHRCE
jgi:hypothetical protein